MFSDAPADHSLDVLAVAPGVDLALLEHGPCLIGGISTLDDTSFTTKIAVHNGPNALTSFCCVALLDTGSPQTFIRRDMLDSIFLVGGASISCKQKYAPLFWGGFGESAPLQTPTIVRLSVQLIRGDEPTCSLEVWACAPSAM